MAKKLIIIGIDGASYSLIKENASRLRFLSKLLKNNDLKPLISTIPPSTVPAWMSIFTGVNPGKHGYFGFTEQHSYEYKLVRFHECPIPKIWNTLSNQNLKGVVINVPTIYPVEKIHGAMIAGMFSPQNKMNEKTVFPSHIIPLLKKLNYIIDVNPSILKNLSLKEVSDRVSTIINARTETFKLLMESFDADFGVLVYTILDRIQHLFWHKKDFVLSIYKLIDEKINELLNYFNSPIIIISDHGFRGTRRGLVMCLMLRELGYLKFRDDYSKLLLSIIKMKISGGHPTIEYQSIDWRKTLAYFRRDSWGIILNLLNRQTNGIIREEEYENTLCNLIADLKSTGLFEYVCKKSIIYQGPYINKAPDILLIPRSDIKLLSLKEAAEMTNKGTNKGIKRIVTIKDVIRKGDTIVNFDKIQGEHDLVGIIGVYGGYLQDKPLIYDISPSILKFFDIKIPSNLDGKPLIEFEV